jgi:hypothetical protein
MKLVIDVDEEDYGELTQTGENTINLVVLLDLREAVRNGTPLPKNYGRLISADNLIKAIEEKAKRLSNADIINGLCGAVALIFDAPTIIEAESEEEE